MEVNAGGKKTATAVIKTRAFGNKGSSFRSLRVKAKLAQWVILKAQHVKYKQLVLQGTSKYSLCYTVAGDLGQRPL